MNKTKLIISIAATAILAGSLFVHSSFAQPAPQPAQTSRGTSAGLRSQAASPALQSEKLTNGVTRLWTSVNMYIVEGADKALLIDTGNSGDISPEKVKVITPLPLLVVNTHAHPDHSGNNRLFGKVHIHTGDLEAVKRYGGDYFALTNGYVFDLGGRKLEVISVPGHTPGSICLLDARNKMLFTGDTANSQVWMHISRLPLETYLRSMKKLLQRQDEYSTIFIGHGVGKASFIADLVSCAQAILDGKDPRLTPPPAGSNQAPLGISGGSTYGVGQVQIRYNPSNLLEKR